MFWHLFGEISGYNMHRFNRACCSARACLFEISTPLSYDDVWFVALSICVLSQSIVEKRQVNFVSSRLRGSLGRTKSSPSRTVIVVAHVGDQTAPGSIYASR